MKHTFEKYLIMIDKVFGKIHWYDEILLKIKYTFDWILEEYIFYIYLSFENIIENIQVTFIINIIVNT